jgi:hypothetical protein
MRARQRLLAHVGSGGNNYQSSAVLQPYAVDDTAAGAAGQLYDLEADPGEQRNLYREQGEKARELEELLQHSIRTGRSVPERAGAA